MIHLSQNKLKEFINYDPITGLISSISGKAKPRPAAGGYLRMYVDGKRYLVHRLAALYMLGDDFDQTLDIDHDNHIKDDNSWDNIEPKTHEDNMKNRLLSSNNKSGFAGVCWIKGRSKWQAYIHIDNKKKVLGEFKCKLVAVTTRKQAEMKYNYKTGVISPREA